MKRIDRFKEKIEEVHTCEGNDKSVLLLQEMLNQLDTYDEKTSLADFHKSLNQKMALS
ncbi:hypothetical protein IMZ31_20285 (plasmid) [Pontibacillus sp. ALD_SL1]|uniref:hypothetical protein n=1 Tax=Pontibacillus sp. ALD_SL1 TaxID=2777185 RepID=UPI001A97607E|nr:hypothetical protein [Pontibacillus sp. ALD_SL1]QST02889.1 hypothetical protein IMZ31_20285 [Pontibacillus sp. ALD_SL1]